MGSEYTFYDYIDADESGANIIKGWLNGDGKAAKAHFMMLIGQLETSTPPGGANSFWTKRRAPLMWGQWRGFRELRKTGGVQPRLLAKIQDRSVYLVTWANHTGGQYKTDVTPGTAKARVSQMINNPARYRREHEHN